MAKPQQQHHGPSCGRAYKMPRAHYYQHGCQVIGGRWNPETSSKVVNIPSYRQDAGITQSRWQRFVTRANNSVVKKWFSGPCSIQNYLHSRKFRPKKTPQRKAATISSLYLLKHLSRMDELGLKLGPPRVQMNNHSYVFLKGHWFHQRCILDNCRTHQHLKMLEAENKNLEEQNNYLKLQVEILFDMLLEATAKLPLGKESSFRGKGKTHPSI
ncbi:protein chibby homolog 1-like isoform X2 [Mixophyes fleayi]|uniref:protein chibby homolog 1-like isoform X2 n=1 Tax=Mixophyes fleayi TaxID=3061075 RepID=UPI003F4D8DEE